VLPRRPHTPRRNPSNHHRQMIRPHPAPYLKLFTMRSPRGINPPRQIGYFTVEHVAIKMMDGKPTDRALWWFTQKRTSNNLIEKELDAVDDDNGQISRTFVDGDRPAPFAGRSSCGDCAAGYTVNTADTSEYAPTPHVTRRGISSAHLLPRFAFLGVSHFSIGSHSPTAAVTRHHSSLPAPSPSCNRHNWPQR